LAQGDCLIGGEESGGLSIVGHIPEKDGILACLLTAELVAVRKKSLGGILKELYREVGPYFTVREDFHLSEKKKTSFVRKIKSLSQRPYFSGKTISKFVGLDGYKFIFADGSWIMFRVSGTERVVRCYCEAKSKAQLKNLLTRGDKLIKR
jgi:phosphomannomutase